MKLLQSYIKIIVEFPVKFDLSIHLQFSYVFTDFWNNKPVVHSFQDLNNVNFLLYI